MLKQLSTLEHKIGDRIYQLHVSSDSPLGELHTALSHMMGYVVQRINEAHEASKTKESESVNPEVLPKE